MAESTSETPLAVKSPAAPATPHAVRVEIAALSDRGRVRERNEDAYVVFRMGRYLERMSSNVPESELPSRYETAGHLMIVADGLGGHEGGDVASRTALVTAMELILRSPRWALRLDDPATREAEIRQMFERSKGYFAAVHAMIRDRASRDPRLAGMGTTLTGAYTVGDDLFLQHVGDSKAFLFREGRMRKITHDHTVAQEYADLGVIPQEAVARHQMHHVLTRAVGGPEAELHADMHHVGVLDGDRLLLCSDGLTDMAEEDEIAQVLAAHPTSEEACHALVDLALECGGRDNVTVIVAGYAVS